ncbi:MAG: hypothetical protein IKB75_00125 [Clostridia bacterium]|nr:hypothetical protein [Clostridia bacterium]
MNSLSGIAWSILGFMAPLIGVILYLAWKDDEPWRAKMILRGALTSLIIGAVIIALYIILCVVALFWLGIGGM